MQNEGKHMTKILAMSDLYKKLNALGFDKSFIDEYGLPTWWNEELESSPISVLEGISHVADRLSLNLKSLLVEGEEPVFLPIPHTKFKHKQYTEKEAPILSSKIASRVAKIVAKATQLRSLQIPSCPLKIRDEILTTNHQVNLDSILDYCWKQGISVVHFDMYPKNSRKFDGMIQRIDGQAVIVLSNANQNPSWIAFHLAHELGHLAYEHIQEEIFFDEKINKKSDDQEEKDANEFAIKLLLNNHDNFFGKQRFNAEQFAGKIQNVVAKNPDIDPCALAFNYAKYNDKYYPLAQETAKELLQGRETGSAQKIINQCLKEHIKWDDLNDDDVDYLDVILGG